MGQTHEHPVEISLMIRQADAEAQPEGGILAHVLRQSESPNKGLRGAQIEHLIQAFNKAATLQFPQRWWFLRRRRLFIQLLVATEHTGEALLQVLVAYLRVELIYGLAAQPIPAIGQEHDNGLQQSNCLAGIVHLDHDLSAHSSQAVEDKVVGHIVRLPGVQDYTTEKLES